MNEGLMVRTGHVVDEEEAVSLSGVVRDLRAQLAGANRELAQIRRDTERAERAYGRLRQQLSPLYRALQAVFGELDGLGVEESATNQDTQQTARTSVVWDSWKSRFPGRPAQVIDALLLHGSLNTTQIGLAIGMSRSNVPPVIHKLNKAGLLNKSGDKFSLKQL